MHGMTDPRNSRFTAANFPLRLPTVLLTEGDAEFDLDWWIDLFKRTNVEGVTWTAGGYMAFYPTRIPLHYRARWIGERDVFGECVAACRKIGMKIIIARTDPHAVHQDVCDAHPDWIFVDRNGHKLRHWRQADAWVTCALGPYNFEFMHEVNREIFSRYDVDLLFSNRWAGQSICYCEHCRRNFHDASGRDLPRAKDVHDPAYRAYMLWRENRLLELISHWNAGIHAVKPHCHFIPNAGGGATSELDMKRLGDQVPLLVVDRQARGGLAAPWANGKNAKEFRATLGPGKPALSGANVGICGKYRWMDSTKSEPEYRMWLAEAVAHGMAIRYTKHMGVVYDRRWVKTVEEFFGWHASVETYLRNVEPLARVGLVYSQQTGRFYGGDRAEEKVEDHILGMYQALVEARIPFEMVHDHNLDADHLAPFKTLILPNTAALSDAQCREIRAFVEHGGSLVATFETSLYDEWGARRPTFGLADLFGVDAAGAVEGPLNNTYLTVERDANGRIHPLLAGLEHAGRIVYGIYRQPVQPQMLFAETPLTLVPSYPDLPMEELYPRQPRTNIAEVYLRHVGRGRVVYFPWDIDRCFWEVLDVDHGLVLGNAVRWATNEEPMVTVEGPGQVDIAVWRQQRSITVNLVNLNNPMTMRGPYRELMPSPEQIVHLRLPDGERAEGVRLLRCGRTPVWQARDGCVTVTVPSILDLEIVAVDLATSSGVQQESKEPVS